MCDAQNAVNSDTDFSHTKPKLYQKRTSVNSFASHWKLEHGVLPFFLLQVFDLVFTLFDYLTYSKMII